MVGSEKEKNVGGSGMDRAAKRERRSSICPLEQQKWSGCSIVGLIQEKVTSTQGQVVLQGKSGQIQVL
jgi:hypothetical protein